MYPLISIAWCYDIDMLPALLALCEGNPLVTTHSQKASSVEICWFLIHWSEQPVEQTVNVSLIWDDITYISLG